MEILRERVFHGAGVPEVVEERDDVVLANLSAFTLRHVLPNMGNPGKHGVWFPLGETQMEPWWRLPKNGPDALGPEDRKQLEELDRKNQKQPNDMPQDMPRKLGNPERQRSVGE